MNGRPQTEPSGRKRRGRRAVARASLSEREQDILELIGMSFSIRTTGRVLHISAGTVKWHLKNIYSKLDGYNREQVLQRARALHLIHPVLPGGAPFALTAERQQRLELIARRLDELTSPRRASRIDDMHADH